MSLYAIIKGDEVDGIVIADTPLDTDGKWICIDDLVEKPGTAWKYDGVNFTPPSNTKILPPPNVIPEKTEEEKLADAAAALVAKLIADGVLKQA